MRNAQRRMHARYASSEALVDAVVRSDLADARTEATTLSVLDEPDALPRWRPYVELVQDAARDIDRAEHLRSAARGTAALGVRCASCHVATQARISFAEPMAPPAEDSPLAQQMRAHHRAAILLWQGLMGPSDARWAAGSQALSAMPFDIVAQGGVQDFDNDVDDTTRVRLLGRRAGAARAARERADVFGDLLVTCAHCHAVLRDR